MGKVRPAKVKRLAAELIQRYPDQFSTDFEKNKQLVKEYLPGVTKKLRNRVAGYVTRLMVIKAREAKPTVTATLPSEEPSAAEEA
ncbi:MAG: 30S ribosomal protein S17e [Candidatus Methanomethylicota archaeon]|uniref:Small ribosomal subunit protein eS17 n=1 Tax=Thermoproteota archaeon TaxID=2056631 RepID=A0A497ESE5_9CREN|nr:MAG: 30S ribosomal protein S17e [Candidatus Verstraetearchaeota archaeon]RLE51582.1 MAG: 30S ribosomal protein S17e [Candidatus Verstraetearchaeota archaeon]